MATCGEVYKAQTQLVQQPSSPLRSSWLSSSSAWTWPSLSWLALSSSPWSRRRGRYWARRHPPAPPRCWMNPCWPLPLLLTAAPSLAACGCHSRPSCGRWKRCRWLRSLSRAPSSCRGRPAGHRWRGRLCSSWLCDTGCRHLSRAACRCSRWASSVQAGCAQCYQSAPGRRCSQSRPEEMQQNKFITKLYSRALGE